MVLVMNLQMFVDLIYHDNPRSINIYLSRHLRENHLKLSGFILIFCF
jgi:hypothetical protein